MREIYEAIQNYRGFKNFIKAKTLPHCDFFVPNPGYIVEFDESQHFTLPRKLTLEHYPKGLKLGFHRDKWILQCENISATDKDPPYRDEQRAWYDTLRDFLPELIGFKPTIRLFAKDFKWCSFDFNNQIHISKFKNFFKTENERWNLEIREDLDPFLARIIIAREWKGDMDESRKLLRDVYRNWPKGRRVKFIITCGGFIQFDWPKFITSKDVGNNIYPNNNVLYRLVEKGQKCVKFVLSDGLDKKLGEKTDYITFGVDTRKEKISTTRNFINHPHIELVFLVDLQENKYYWTGKSYPTSSQENGLVRISDMSKHFFNLKDVGKVMVLGCHDLSIFNNRNWNRTGEWRKKIKSEFRKLAKKEKPNYVLHHPHTTVKSKTWSIAWKNLRTTLPTVEQYLGSGIYYEPDREISEYDSIDCVLEATKYGDAVEIIVWK